MDGQAAGGLIEFDAEADRCTLTDEAAAVLADETQPTFVARAMNALGSFVPATESSYAPNGFPHSMGSTRN
ncbi:MAG: hypothetical protein ACPHL6_02230 [Rubripirellula sp.]